MLMAEPLYTGVLFVRLSPFSSMVVFQLPDMLNSPSVDVPLNT